MPEQPRNSRRRPDDAPRGRSTGERRNAGSPRRASKPPPAPRAPSTLPRPLQEELRHAARAGAADEAMEWTERALAARATGDLEEVRRAAVRAKQAAPRSPTVRELLGVAAYRLQQWHEAAQELLAYRRFSGSHKHDAVVAECYRLEGKPERALAFLETLARDDLTPAMWRAAQIARARALADAGKRGVGIAILEAEQRTSADPALEAVLRELRTDQTAV